MKRLALQNKQVVVLRMAFRARKVLGTFEKRATGLVLWHSKPMNQNSGSTLIKKNDHQSIKGHNV